VGATTVAEGMGPAKPTHFAQLAGPGEVQTHRSRPACEYS
jgi:hypothetical protein